MNNVVDIEDSKKHVNIYGQRVHVLPLSIFESIAKGEVSITSIEDFDDVVPTIIREWLDVDNKYLKSEIKRLRTAITNTLNDNLDLCDGEQCTLLELKKSIDFD